MSEAEAKKRHLPVQNSLANEGLFIPQPRVLILLPDIHRPAHHPQRVIAIKTPKLAAFLLNVAAARANEQNTTVDQLGVAPDQAAGIVALLDADQIGSSAAAPLLVHCETSDESAEALAKQHGLLQVSDEGQLDAWVDAVIQDPKLAKAVDDVRGGNAKAIGALVGAVMKVSRGQANPKAVSQKLNAKLSS